MSRQRTTQASIDARRLLAYAEERALLQRELIRLHEQLMTDLIGEVIGQKADALIVIQREMKASGIIAPQYDV